MWDWNYVVEILPELIGALQMTVWITLCAFVLALIVGLLLAFAARSKFKPISLITKGIIEFVRNTPLLVQVFFLYYSLPLITNLSIPAFYAGVIGLGLHYSTYLSEVYRSGIEAVDKGQWEAATALNYTKAQTWRTIILPQAIPPIIPVLGNYLIVMFKETPILSAITVVELMLTAKNIVSESFRAFEPYTLVGILFLIISYVSSLLVQQVEKRLNLQRGK
ncbi:ectoine/hydroxyectoine ABC transporter permease subunit EhuD [Paenibacillus urinalis]|uniref:Ectoine/hydroxyectoine ABC transporter permease subunit EhuD n=1 Tax=Paenibacillus urinalis TaxID=521520 RepID=A0ABY7X5Z5_9BACL|nr:MULTISPECIES: ectoine/hydroxyectoine ABC transporter permease subunit EhuD [Paenibacillus]WDH96651.1 ectoine/hydroxyectoine ABC transporter permease subunit EhuD [Paenibacillus urinalis]WDI00295.1 ectoine/hydroxyectoine ABC transporter permease subunit EhuD [Paenibacillus urinalis]GAK40805.1 amino acid ABC transporter permease protein [Paenibacillus sp. TCA20]